MRNVGAFIRPTTDRMATTAPRRPSNLQCSTCRCAASSCGTVTVGLSRRCMVRFPPEAPNLNRWLTRARPRCPRSRASRPQAAPSSAVVLQLSALREATPHGCSWVQSGQISLHGWHYVIEDGEVLDADWRVRAACSRTSAGPLPAPCGSMTARCCWTRIGPAPAIARESGGRSFYPS